MIKHPEDMADDSGYDFVRAALNELEAALFADSFPDSRWRELIDLDTWIDYIMINEITRNVDVQNPHSVYLYRNGGDNSVIRAGPLWDFDYGFDCDDKGLSFNDAAGMYRNTKFREGGGEKFFSRFFEDPYFRIKYKERWNGKYSDIAGIETFIDKMAVLLEKSAGANSKVWWWKKADYKKETERLKAWWKARIAYLNTEINKWGF
jgi:spore coat protein CotH